MTAHTPLTLDLPDELRELLERVAAASDKSESGLVAEAVEEFLQTRTRQLELITEGQRAADAGQTVSSQAVDAWLESWGTDRKLPPPK